MADFVLTQTDAQVQSVLNDAQDAQGAGAQTTLTTEYVMLKDTNGRYHKILKSSLTEACRNVLASLLVNNDKGQTISQIPAIASGDFGSVTPANLASVLGGCYPIHIVSQNADFNNLDTHDNILCTTAEVASATNIPKQKYSIAMIRKFSTSFIVQLIYYPRETNGYMYIRCKDNGEWGTWRTIV